MDAALIQLGALVVGDVEVTGLTRRKEVGRGEVLAFLGFHQIA
jgi:hypothetical protein